ncbi:MAG: TIGR02677 family protein [Opitutaceae bacterium]
MPDRFSAFAHLNAPNAPLYRAILGVFVAERARFAIALRPSEIAAGLAAAHADDPASSTPLAEIENALRQLKDWGNLDDSPDTAEAATIEEFYRDRRLYQLSAAGEAAEQALSVFDEYLHRPGELQTTALHDILELLDALLPRLADDPPDDAKLHHALSALAARSEELTSRAQSFMRGLQRTVDLHGISVDAFLAYKERLIDYLEKFIGELVVATNRIAEALLQLETCGIALAFAAAARREQVDALESTPGHRDAAEARWRERWTGLRRWFIGEGGRPSQAELLRARARSAIPALLTAVTQINDRRASRADRAADFMALARWFAEAPDDAAAHRLWRAAFALSPARHLRVNEETLAARAQQPELPRTSWLEATPMWISPRLRQTGRAAIRGAAQPTIDRSRDKARLAVLAREQMDELARARERLLHGGRHRLAEIGPLRRAEFRLFLDLLGAALARRAPGTGGIEAISAGGSLRVRLEPVPEGEFVPLETADGIFFGRDHWVTIASALEPLPAPAAEEPAEVAAP